jgi:transposase
VLDGSTDLDTLRRRTVDSWREERLGIDELAERFRIGTATAKRLIRQYRETARVEPKPHGGGKPRVLGDQERTVPQAAGRAASGFHAS